MRLDKVQQRKKCDIGFGAFFMLAAAFLLWKTPYGFHFSDEAYYLTVPYRMAQGDRLFADMWDVGQLSMLPTYPLMKLYLLLAGSTEGMVLNFRYIYLFFHAMFSLWLYLILRRSFPLGAASAAIVYLLFSPINIMQLSYNSYGIGFITLSGALLSEKRKILLAGALYALAVLSCPYAAVLFVIFSVYALKDGEGRTLWKKFTAGVVLTAAVFLIYVSLTAGIGEMLRALPEFFNNPTHPVGGVLSRLSGIISDFLFSRKPVTAGLIASLALIAAYLISGRKKAMRRIAPLIAAAAAVCGMLYEMKTDRWINCLMVPMCYLGLTAYSLGENKNKGLFRYVYIAGWVYGVCVYLGSDLGYMTMSGALTVSACASCYFIARTGCELYSEGNAGRAAAFALALALVCQTGAQAWYRKNFCFSEIYNTAMMYENVEKGSGKGEKTSTDAINYEFYQVWDSSERVREAEGEYVLYFSKDCWLYLEDEKRCAAQSAWIQMGYTVTEAERLIDFWQAHPEKKPDAIYVSAETENAERVIEIINTEKFPIEKNDRGFVLVRN